MSNVVNLAEYKESKKYSPFETDISCGCGEKMWDATSLTEGEIMKAEKVLVCRSCTAMIALGLEE